MKKITDYRRLLGVQENTGLQELKTIYRNLMKNWHPDKFADNEEQKHEAEIKCKQIIEAYHFLVSIAPETKLQTLSDYNKTTGTSGITDYNYKSQVLTINFVDGNTYEYLGVPKPVYVKFINAESPGRFARRHIYNSYTYRSTTKLTATADV